MMSTKTKTATIGQLLKEWRQKRRLSQLDFSCQAEISTRHLSFVENGKSCPSRDMVIHLARQLEIPPGETNTLLLVAGYAPAYPMRPLTDPELSSALKTVELILNRQKPFPAFAFDDQWNIVASNAALPTLYNGVAEHLLSKPTNLLRLSLHPQGLRSKIVNLAEWQEHLMHELDRQINTTANEKLIELRAELLTYKSDELSREYQPEKRTNQMAIPLVISSEVGDLAFLSTTTVFGTPVDVTLSELALELFFPLDEETEKRVHLLSDTKMSS
jgi:transcriptional regulator with XRE-family HTH domain